MENILISGFSLNDNNRGTAALGFGSITFLQLNYGLSPATELVNIEVYRDCLHRENCHDKVETININGQQWTYHHVKVFWPIYQFAKRLGLLLPFTKMRRIIKNMKYVAAINGGDGFSDIYGTPLFYSRLPDTLLAMKLNIPVILLPQTIGPFSVKGNYDLAKRILLYSKDVYVRDEKYIAELDTMGVKFELAKDLSFYMQPEPWDIDIKEGAIGLNISGLAYSNGFKTLAGQFDKYKYLCRSIVKYFQKRGNTIYLIPHSYRYGDNPNPNNDDIVASRDFYNKLENKEGVVLLDKDLISPKTKYVISKMSFFIGTRMHANFAAIYTHVPVFGLAYSYKFKGAFDANGLDGDVQTAMINNITKEQADVIVTKIATYYNMTLNN